jgi:hypothetical protein
MQHGKHHHRNDITPFPPILFTQRRQYQRGHPEPPRVQRQTRRALYPCTPQLCTHAGDTDRVRARCVGCYTGKIDGDADDGEFLAFCKAQRVGRVSRGKVDPDDASCGGCLEVCRCSVDLLEWGGFR